MGLSLRRINQAWSGADFWDKKENQKQRQQAAAQAPPRQAPTPRVPMRAGFRATPLPANAPQPVRAPVVFRPTDPTKIGDLNINQPKPKVTGKGAPLEGVFNAATTGERTVAKVLARVLPGGQNDIKAQNEAIDAANRNRRFIMDSNMKPQVKSKLLQVNKEALNVNSKAIEETKKSIPTRGQAAAGVVSTVADALSGGTIKGLKLGTKARVSLRASGNAVAGGANAAAGGGDKQEIAQNFAAGAVLPEVLSGAKLTNKAIKTVKTKVAPPTETGKLLKPGKVKLGMSANENLDNIVNTYVNNTDENIAPRNPVVRFTTQAQEKLYRQPVDRARDKVNEVLTKGLTSDNSKVSKATAIPTLSSNRFGLKDSVRNIIRERNGTQENAGRTFMQLSKGLNERYNSLDGAAQDRLSRYFFDKDTVKALHGQGFVSASKKVPYNQLSDEEKAIADQLMHINKHTNNINLQVGKINKDQYLLGTNGRHTPRIFDFEGRTKGMDAGRASLMDAGVGRKRKDISKFSPEVIAQMEKNPILAILARSETAIRDQATHDAMRSFAKEGLVRKTAPKNNKNFSKLEGPQYGKYNGQYIYKPVRSEIDGHLQANTDWGQHVTDMIDMYQNSKLGSVDRFFKSTKTTLSPGTFLGNIVSNPVAFNSAAGVNMGQQAGNMTGAAGRLVRDAYGSFDRGLYEARKRGVAVNDTGRQLTGDRRKEFLGVDSTKRTKNPAKLAGHAYGGVDQAAQLALYTELRKRGLDPMTAARRVQLGTQDYGGVGRGVQNLADSPILGKPFARFTPELLRLIKNNVLYNPAGTALKGAAVVAGADKLSGLAHEKPEERKAREGATGQTIIPTSALPFVDKDIPLNFAVPGKDGGSSVNIARLTGLNYPIDPGGDAKSGLVNQLSPFAIPIRRNAQGKNVAAPAEVVSSLSLRPIADQIANRDFMGRSISDPDNKTYIEGVGDKGKKYVSNLSTHDKTNNRIRTALSGYAPLFNEIYSGKSAAQGKPDYYGKERTPTQAVLRSIGLKVESNSKDVRQKRMDTQQYFEGKVSQVNEFLTKHPNLIEPYAQVMSKTVDRKTNTRVSDTISPEKWSIIKAHPELYGQFKTEAEYDNKHSKNAKGMAKPVDPVYRLDNTTRVNEVLNLRALPTGDGQEREEVLKATAPWYQKFKKDEGTYFDDNDKYYANLKPRGSGEPPKTNRRVEQYNKMSYPEQPDVVKKYYQVKDSDEAKGKAFYRANADALNKAFKAYKQGQLDYTNKKRSIEGYDPIPKSVWDSVTFGYETDEKAAKSLAAKGFGSGGRRSGGGGSGGKDDENSYYSNPYKYTVKAKGRAAKAKVSIRQPQGGGAAKAKPKGKAKVAFKLTKSKV